MDECVCARVCGCVYTFLFLFFWMSSSGPAANALHVPLCNQSTHIWLPCRVGVVLMAAMMDSERGGGGLWGSEGGRGGGSEAGGGREEQGGTGSISSRLGIDPSRLTVAR